MVGCPAPSLALKLQRGSIPAAPNATELLDGSMLKTLRGSSIMRINRLGWQTHH
jgi:hypothetical protein